MCGCAKFDSGPSTYLTSRGSTYISGIVHESGQGTLWSQALEHYKEFEETSQLPLLERCIEICYTMLDGKNEEVVFVNSLNISATEFNHLQRDQVCPGRSHILAQLSQAFCMRHRCVRDSTSFVLAVSVIKEALLVSEALDTFCHTAWVVFVHVLRLFVDEHGFSDQWAWAEDICRHILEILPAGTLLKEQIFQHLGSVFLRRWELAGAKRLSYLEEAMEFSAAMLMEDCISQNPECLSNHATLLHYRYTHFGEASDLGEALRLHRSALDMCPAQHVVRELLFSRLSWCLILRFSASGSIQDVHDAVGSGRDALKTVFDNGLLRANSTNVVANAIQVRFDTLSMESDIDEIVKLRRMALRVCSSKDRSKLLNNLANSLTSRCLWRGSQNDLEEAIQLYREILAITPENDINRRTRAINLAQALSTQFKVQGDIDDINGAVDLLRSIRMSDTFQSKIEQRAFSHAMANALNLRFEALGTINDVEEAAKILEDLMPSISSNDVDRLLDVNQLGKALFLRGSALNRLEDIERSIYFLEQIPRHDFANPAVASVECLHNLSSSYLTKFRHTNDPSDAMRARDLLLELLETVPDGRRERFHCLYKIAQIYIQPGTPYHDTMVGLRYLAQSTEYEQCDVRTRLKYIIPVLKSLEASETSMSIPVRTKLLDVYTTIVSLLPHVAFFGLDLTSRFHHLATGQSIATVAASHAIAIGQTSRALEILEQGRAVFWTHALRLRSQFDEVPDTMRQQLVSLSRLLEQSDTMSKMSSSPQISEKAAARRRQQSETFVSLVKNVRALPGLERFMLHDEVVNLMRASAKGPVVVLVPGITTCYAIILRSSDSPESITLPSITDEWVIHSSSNWRTATIEASIAATDRLKIKTSKPKGAVARQNSAAEQILEDLWTKIVWPIFSVLGLDVSGDRIIPSANLLYV
jgi:tetratricopeptide (TPR) repeat protein